MKTKILTFGALVASLLINAAVATTGSLSLGYGSDYFRRGALVSDSSVQTALSVDQNLLGVDLQLGYESSFSDGNLGNLHVFTAGTEKSISELINCYAGLEHAELTNGSSNLDLQLSLGLDTLLNPSASVYRNTSDEMYTFEFSVSHDVELGSLPISFEATLGQTENPTVEDLDYQSISAATGKEIFENLDLSMEVSYVNSESMSEDFIVGAFVSTSF